MLPIYNGKILAQPTYFVSYIDVEHFLAVKKLLGNTSMAQLGSLVESSKPVLEEDRGSKSVDALSLQCTLQLACMYTLQAPLMGSLVVGAPAATSALTSRDLPRSAAMCRRRPSSETGTVVGFRLWSIVSVIASYF